MYCANGSDRGPTPRGSRQPSPGIARRREREHHGCEIVRHVTALQRRQTPHAGASASPIFGFEVLGQVTQARRNAIITGAASGLGRALAVRLARDGWSLALADIDAEGNDETLRRVEAAGGVGRLEPLDVACAEDWESLRGRLRQDWSQLDLLVNNAGIGCSGDVGKLPLDEWRLLLSVNLQGGIYGCHTMIDWLKANSSGSHIINVASFAAIAPSPSMGAYNVAKAGMLALSETLYGELKPYGVGVTVVCPMYFRTNIHRRARNFNESKSKSIEQSIEKSTMTAERVADVAVRAMKRKQLYAVPGGLARWYWWLRRMTPTAFLDGMAREAMQQASDYAESQPAAETP